MVKSQLETEWELSEEALEVYYLDLISYRSISNKVAEITGVPHQSPQIILLRNGEVQYHTSHSAISAKRVKKERGYISKTVIFTYRGSPHWRK